MDIPGTHTQPHSQPQPPVGNVNPLAGSKTPKIPDRAATRRPQNPECLAADTVNAENTENVIGALTKLKTDHQGLTAEIDAIINTVREHATNLSKSLSPKPV